MTLSHFFAKDQQHSMKNHLQLQRSFKQKRVLLTSIFRNLKRNIVSVFAFWAILQFFGFEFQFNPWFLQRTKNSFKLEHNEMVTAEAEPGDCQAIGRRRPEWANRTEIIQTLPQFGKIYETRPFKRNTGGMRFLHSFGLWYMLRAISPTPTTVIESGANRGHSTWIIRQALPSSRIITITPRKPLYRDKKATYMTNNNFRDFNETDWVSYGLNIEDTVILFDDHQSSFRRIFKEGMKMGFRRFIVDDNCDYQSCDAVSVKWLCEVKRKNEWRGYVLDNFGKHNTSQTWEEHLSEAKQLKTVKAYYEFPPVIEDRRGLHALIKNEEELKLLIGDLAHDKVEFKSYAFLGFLELFERAQSSRMRHSFNLDY